MQIIVSCDIYLCSAVSSDVTTLLSRFLDSRTFVSCSDDTSVVLWDVRNLKHRVSGNYYLVFVVLILMFRSVHYGVIPIG